MATLEGSPIHGGDMFKGPQIKGITSQYSSDVNFITTHYKSNNTTSSRNNLIDLRKKYKVQRDNGLDDETKRHINIIYRAVSWAKENNIENEHLKMKRGKMFRFENNRISRASYAQIGQSYLNSIEPDMFKLPPQSPLSFEAITETTGAKNRKEDYTKDYYDKVVSLLLKYAGALKNGNLSCGKCETVFQIVREAIQQNVKEECLKSTDILMPNESAVSHSSLTFSSPAPPVPPPVNDNMSPMDTPKVDTPTPKETIKDIGYEMIDLSTYFKSNNSAVLEAKIVNKISESSLQDKEITSIKEMIKPLLTDLKKEENQDPLKSLVYILTIYQLEQFYILMQDSFGMFVNSSSNYLTERKQKSLLESDQYKALPQLIDSANNNDFKQGFPGLTLQQYANDFSAKMFQKANQSKDRFADRLRIWEKKPFLYESNYDTNRRYIRDMSFDKINDLLNVNSSVYNSISGEASIAPGVTLGGRGSRRRNKKNNKTFKRVRAGKTHKVHKSKRKLTKKK
jgi:hypothetical protein